jgi:RNA polymerase sigma-B factor
MRQHQRSAPAEIKEKFAAYAASRDPELRAELVEAHLGLAHFLAHRFANRGESFDDLVQVGSLALVKAVDRYDPTRGVEFATYATQTIAGEIKRHFRDRGWAVRAPRRMQELYLRLGDVVSNLSQQLGRAPSIAEIAQAASTTEEDVLAALEAGRAYRWSSLDADLDEDEYRRRWVAEEEAGFEAAENRALLRPLLERLPWRRRLIIKLRFLDGLTQSEIASRLGISQMHVSRLLSRSLAELRSAAQARRKGD